MREADLMFTKCSGAILRDLDLSGAWLHKADLTGADLRGSDLSALDPLTADIAGAIITLDQTLTIAEGLRLDVRPTTTEDL